jgi:hypothetical protein
LDRGDSCSRAGRAGVREEMDGLKKESLGWEYLWLNIG